MMMTLNSIYQGMLFAESLDSLPSQNSFYCEKIEDSDLRLGISLDRLPTILIPCEAGEENQSKQKFQGLQLHQHKKCNVINDEDDENYSIDENGTEWFEDDDGYWWFREEGQEEWQPYEDDDED